MITKSNFGKTSDGKEVFLFKLVSSKGAEAQILNYGGIIVSLTTIDKNKNAVDVVLGYDTLEKYEKQEKYLGALIGRYSNRIANANFTLNDKQYTLYKNDGNNHLHGGMSGFDKKVWQYEILENHLILTYHSPDGEEGYPGNLDVTVTYSFDDENGLVVDYKAVTDEDTVVNLTNHSYFNLDGQSGGDILNQYIKIYSDNYTPADSQSIPHGEIAPVENTPLDFRTPARIGEHIDDDFEAVRFTKGYDQNFILNNIGTSPYPAAYAYSKNTGITLTVLTTMPALHFYSGNYLEGAANGKGNVPIGIRSGFCLETQYYPNSPCVSQFPSTVLKSGDIYHHQTIFRLGLLSD